MYSYIPVTHNFRVSAWPAGGDHYTDTYSSYRYKFDIKSVLDYVKDQLEKVASAFVFKTSFTLINVYSDYFQNSIGYCAEPSSNVRVSPITFTFARSFLDGHYAKPIFWQTHYTAVWGTTHERPSDFISISLPIDLISRSGINRALNSEMRAFYDILGAYTKAIVMKRLPIGTTNPEIIKSKVLYWNIPKAMWELPIQDWAYCQDFWNRIPALLTIDWTPAFLEYYCLYIAPNLPALRSETHNLYSEQARDRITQFLLRYLQNVDLPEEQNLLRFLPIMGPSLDIQKLASDISQGKIP